MMYPATVLPHRTNAIQGARTRDLQRWRPDSARIRGKIYLAVTGQIEQAIRAGVLQPGGQLPTQRHIADDLGFHLNTTNAEFREASRRDLIESRSRRGTIVSFRADMA